MCNAAYTEHCLGFCPLPRLFSFQQGCTKPSRVLGKNREEVHDGHLAVNPLSCSPEPLGHRQRSPASSPACDPSHLNSLQPVLELSLNQNLSRSLPFELHVAALASPAVSSAESRLQTLRVCSFSLLRKGLTSYSTASASRLPFPCTSCFSLGKEEAWTWLMVLNPEQRGSQGPPKRSPNHFLHSNRGSPSDRFF